MKLKPILIIIAIVLILFTGSLLIINIGSVTGEVSQDSVGLRFEAPKTDYRVLEPYRCFFYDTNIVSFDDYKFEILSSSSVYYNEICESTESSGTLISNDTDEYGCEIKTYNVNLASTSSCKGSSNCPYGSSTWRACDGKTYKCSKWEKCVCSMVSRSRTDVLGGRKLIENSGHGFTWRLSYQDEVIAERTDFNRDELYFNDGVNECDDIQLKDGKPYCTVDDYDYRLYKSIRGNSYSNICDNDIPYSGFSLMSNYDLENNLNISVNLEESYIEGEEAEVKIVIDNQIGMELLGIFTTTYTIDTFAGNLDKDVTKELQIMEGYNEYILDFSTNGSITDFTISNDIDLYRKNIDNFVVVKEKVYNRENDNVDKILVSNNDWIKIADVSFANIDIDILPKVTEQDLEQIQQDLENKEQVIYEIEQERDIFLWTMIFSFVLAVSFLVFIVTKL